VEVYGEANKTKHYDLRQKGEQTKTLTEPFSVREYPQEETTEPEGREIDSVEN
jgi:hypothetical protein